MYQAALPITAFGHRIEIKGLSASGWMPLNDRFRRNDNENGRGQGAMVFIESRQFER
jgi:hypothetical protein